MSPIEEIDTTLIQLCGLQVIADAEQKQTVVDACSVVLDALLDIRIHLPQQRTTTADAPADVSSSEASTRG